MTNRAPVEARGEIPGSSHIVRLWAAEEVLKLVRNRRVKDAVGLAGLYQLVTPVSGAVVLETQQQFTNAGLTPADPMSVPAVPEPGTWALILVGVGVFWLFSRRRRLVAKSTCPSSER